MEATDAVSTAVTYGVVGNIQIKLSESDGWLACDGRLLEIIYFPALFTKIGARFGGDGVTTFKLPKLDDPFSFHICAEGWYPIKGMPPGAWRTTVEESDEITRNVQALTGAYAAGINPFGHGTHSDKLDNQAMDMQALVLADAYSRGEDPLHRHQHMDELDKDWLEMQTRSMIAAHECGQGNPSTYHRRVSDFPEGHFEMQAQVLIDAVNRGEEPLPSHESEQNLDPEWLSYQVKSRQAADACGFKAQDHVHVDNIDDHELERRAQVVKDAVERGDDPNHKHQHVDDLDPEWLKMQAQVLMDAQARAEAADERPDAGDAACMAVDPMIRFAREDEVDETRLQNTVEAMIQMHDEGKGNEAIVATPEVLEEDEGRAYLSSVETAKLYHAAGLLEPDVNDPEEVEAEAEAPQAEQPVAKNTTRKAPAKKLAAKKAPAKKPAAKKAPAKKPAAKKPVAKKAPAKKTTARKTTSKAKKTEDK